MLEHVRKTDTTMVRLVQYVGKMYLLRKWYSETNVEEMSRFFSSKSMQR